MKLKGILVEPDKLPKVYEFDCNSYKDFYPVLDCEIFEIPRRKFGKNYYDIYCDEEGFLNDKIPAIFTFDDDCLVEIIRGNCFICKHDDEGEAVSLTDNEIAEIMGNIKQDVLVCEL